MSQLKRLIDLDRMIRSGHCPSPESLAAQFGVTRRQIFLDRKRLIEDLGAPLIFDRKKGHWRYGDLTWVLPTSIFTEGELLAFFLSVEIARSQGNAAFGEILQSAVGKISRSLGDVVTVDVKALEAATNVEPPPAAPIRSEIYWEITNAKALRAKVKMRYFTASRGTWKERIVHPYHLLLSRGECFLLAYDEDRKEVRSFNLARIEKLQRLEARFITDPNFDLKTFRRKMLWAEAGPIVYEIVVRFDAYQARYIRERNWHNEEISQDQPDGSLILHFPSSGLQEVARWVLGYGQHAQVLEPAELRDIMREHIAGMTRFYGGEE